MCCLRLTNVKHNKSCFMKERTKKTRYSYNFSSKKWNFQHINRITLAVHFIFYFFDIVTIKKVIQSLKNTKITDFEITRIFFCISDIKKLKRYYFTDYVLNYILYQFRFLVMIVAFSVIFCTKQFSLCFTFVRWRPHIMWV
jgi:hypothetical protein